LMVMLLDHDFILSLGLRTLLTLMDYLTMDQKGIA
jgi:hypothetical protein